MREKYYCKGYDLDFIAYLSVSMIVEDKLIASFHNGSDELCEKDELNTFIDFQCGPEAMWSAMQGQNHGDASAYFDGLIIDFENLCSVSCMLEI